MAIVWRGRLGQSRQHTEQCDHQDRGSEASHGHLLLDRYAVARTRCADFLRSDEQARVPGGGRPKSPTGPGARDAGSACAQDATRSRGPALDSGSLADASSRCSSRVRNVAGRAAVPRGRPRPTPGRIVSLHVSPGDPPRRLAWTRVNRGAHLAWRCGRCCKAGLHSCARSSRDLAGDSRLAHALRRPTGHADRDGPDHRGRRRGVDDLGRPGPPRRHRALHRSDPDGRPRPDSRHGSPR